MADRALRSCRTWSGTLRLSKTGVFANIAGFSLNSALQVQNFNCHHLNCWEQLVQLIRRQLESNSIARVENNSVSGDGQPSTEQTTRQASKEQLTRQVWHAGALRVSERHFGDLGSSIGALRAGAGAQEAGYGPLVKNLLAAVRLSGTIFEPTDRGHN